jgi:orotidine-5'-phosphate decarboxylase
VRGEDERAAVRSIERFCREVLEAVAAHVPCVKLQSACFERYGAPGVEALEAVIATAAGHGLQVILDAKRGDIGISAAHYAAAAFGAEDEDGGPRPDWITINSYFGNDGIEPFLRESRGAFALVRTSNPGADAIQQRRLEDGSTVAEAVGRLVADLGESSLGRRGYSALGAVVAATRAEAARGLRELMPRQLFLVPGFGAQGGGAEDVLPCFHADGTGAVVTASRSVIYAFDPGDRRWAAAVATAAADLAREVGEVLGRR